MTHGRFHWNELLTRDVERAKRFYAETVGWTYEEVTTPDGEPYWLVLAEGVPAAGLFDISGMAGMEHVPDHWIPYLAVDDVDARVERATAAGAKLHRGPFEIPNFGRIALLGEPGGAGIAWMTPFPQTTN